MSDSPVQRAPALLTAASYYGTLAAVRCLGRRGVPVTVAEGRLLAPARWSRYTTRRTSCPPLEDAERFLDWLDQFGREHPGHVLYPTTDDLAWLFSNHRDELARDFRLYSPPVEAVYALLNKQRLEAAARQVGLETPRTWFPETDGDLDRIGREARFPVLVKPQTQVLFASRSKGARADDLATLRTRWRGFQAEHTHGQPLLAFDPGASRPMVQEFHAGAAEGIYSVSGFVDRSGERFVGRAAVKVLQRPRKLGIGLCFEAAPLREDLAAGIALLCKQVGYFGVFEVEFLVEGDRCLLLDFNPRLFSQMAFDVDRGVPLPYLVYLGALGRDEELGAEVARIQAYAETGGRVYSHRFVLEVLLRGQTLSGRISADEAASWRTWWTDHHDRATDAVTDSGDAVPAVVDLALHLYGYARHPRAFVRSMVLDR